MNDFTNISFWEANRKKREILSHWENCHLLRINYANELSQNGPTNAKNTTTYAYKMHYCLWEMRTDWIKHTKYLSRYRRQNQACKQTLSTKTRERTGIRRSLAKNVTVISVFMKRSTKAEEQEPDTSPRQTNKRLREKIRPLNWPIIFYKNEVTSESWRNITKNRKIT